MRLPFRHTGIIIEVSCASFGTEARSGGERVALNDQALQATAAFAAMHLASLTETLHGVGNRVMPPDLWWERWRASRGKKEAGLSPGLFERTDETCFA